MADAGDMAFDLVAEQLARGLAAIVADAPVGAPGECDECGETMPRLVAGRCGFCRDGRRPPLSFFDRAPAAAPIVVHPAAIEELEVTKSATIDAQTISVPAKGETLAGIRKFADVLDLPLGQTCIALIDRALGAMDGERQAPPALTDIATDAILEEIRRRATITADPAELNDALARADAAELKLQNLRAALLA